MKPETLADIKIWLATHPNRHKIRGGAFGNLRGYYNAFPPLTWTLEDNFDDAGIYTQTGTLVTVDSGAADSLYFNVAANGTDQRVSRALGFTLSNTIWYAQMEWIYTAANIPSHPFFTFCSAVGDVSSTSADRLGFQITDTYTLKLLYADSTTDWTASATEIAVTVSTQYYISHIRLSATSQQLNVYSDSGFTTPITGSPISQTIPSTVAGLANFQASNYSPGSATRTITCKFNTLKVMDGQATPP